AVHLNNSVIPVAWRLYNSFLASDKIYLASNWRRKAVKFPKGYRNAITMRLLASISWRCKRAVQSAFLHVSGVSFLNISYLPFRLFTSNFRRVVQGSG
ncbi:hypothetical protein, partial [Stutzerimonas balearica]|uniref:hypothetical protein n=1 Tax=Stutzerimonas balearica TaxID=74829 RepID=UPI0028AA75CA